MSVDDPTDTTTATEAVKDSAPWRPNGVPYFWVPKEAFDRINQKLERGAAASAKLVYVALNMIANHRGVGTFEVPINYIATIASLERRTVERRLTDLKHLDLVTVIPLKIAGTFSHSPSRYTLTTLSRNLATLSQNLTTARGPQPVAHTKERKNLRGGSPLDRKLSTSERISADNAMKLLRVHIQKLEDDTHHPYQRKEHPELVAELKQKREQLAELGAKLIGGAI